MIPGLTAGPFTRHAVHTFFKTFHMRNQYKYQSFVYRFMVLVAAFLMVLIYNSTRASVTTTKAGNWEEISLRMKKHCMNG